MIFVDTGAWYARYIADDVDHAAALAWFANAPDRLLTTDYVLDELLTLLKQRGHRLRRRRTLDLRRGMPN